MSAARRRWGMLLERTGLLALPVGLGAVLGVSERAREVVAQMESEREALRQARPEVPARVYLEWWPKPMFSPGSDCYSSGIKQIWDDIPASQTRKTVVLDDFKFQGEELHWAVLACSDDAFCGDFSPHQPLRYIVPPPSDFWMAGIDVNELDLENHFMNVRIWWNTVFKADLYFLCVTTGSVSECGYLKTSGTIGNPYIKNSGIHYYIIDNNLPQFRGNTVNYTVAACTGTPADVSEEDCSVYQAAKSMAYPEPP